MEAIILKRFGNHFYPMIPFIRLIILFKKLPGDTIYNWAYHKQHYFQGQLTIDNFYKGDYLVSLYPADSSGLAISPGALY